MALGHVLKLFFAAGLVLSLAVVVREIQAARDIWLQGLARQPDDARIVKTLERLNINLDE